MTAGTYSEYAVATAGMFFLDHQLLSTYPCSYLGTTVVLPDTVSLEEGAALLLQGIIVTLLFYGMERAILI
jgi:NADPH:quinone reductase-like Zn-dependent oxidoreductase